MLDFLEHSPLIIGMFHLLHLDHLLLFQHFHGIKSLIVLRLDQMHSSKASSTQRPKYLEVSQRVFALRLSDYWSLHSWCVFCIVIPSPGCVLAG